MITETQLHLKRPFTLKKHDVRWRKPKEKYRIKPLILNLYEHCNLECAINEHDWQISKYCLENVEIQCRNIRNCSNKIERHRTSTFTICKDYPILRTCGGAGHLFREGSNHDI